MVTYCWKLKVKEIEHGEDGGITRYYNTRKLALQHGFELIKKVLIEDAGWDEFMEENELIKAMKETEEAFYLVTSTYNEITEIEQRSKEYQYLNGNNLSITLKLITIIDTI